MHLFETEKGDVWVCVHCAKSEAESIKEKKWEWIFDKQDATLRCSICNGPDFDYED